MRFEIWIQVFYNSQEMRQVLFSSGKLFEVTKHYVLENNPYKSTSVKSFHNLAIETNYFDQLLTFPMKAKNFSSSRHFLLSTSFLISLMEQETFFWWMPKVQIWKMSYILLILQRSSLKKSRYIKVKVEHYLLFMFSPPKIS